MGGCVTGAGVAHSIPGGPQAELIQNQLRESTQEQRQPAQHSSDSKLPLDCTNDMTNQKFEVCSGDETPAWPRVGREAVGFRPQCLKESQVELEFFENNPNNLGDHEQSTTSINYLRKEETDLALSRKTIKNQQSGFKSKKRLESNHFSTNTQQRCLDNKEFVKKFIADGGNILFPFKFSELEAQNGARYAGTQSMKVGERNGDKKQGLGKLVEADNSQYFGEFKDNLPNGYGFRKMVNGSTFEGEWKDGNEHGNGQYYDAQKRCICVGRWKAGVRDGHAVDKWEDGTLFEGMYQKGRRNGFGKIVFADGSYYQGEFQNDSLSGTGTYNWPRHRKYTGRWLLNQMQGKGRMEWATGVIYEGEFVSSKRQGFGECKWPNGDRYVGHWRNDKQHGEGKLTTSQGGVREGLWFHGKLKESNSHQ